MNLDIRQETDQAQPVASHVPGTISGDAAWVATAERLGEQLSEGLADNDTMIRTYPLERGWDIVRHRGEVYRAVMHDFVEHVVGEVEPRGAFAIHSLGGTGRREMCPRSDVDLGVLVENIEENDHFRRHFGDRVRQVTPIIPGLRETARFFAIHDIRDPERFNIDSLMALLDGDLLSGDDKFNARIHQMGQERAAGLGLEMTFEKSQEMRGFDEQFPQEPGDIGGFHVKLGKGGLRNFQIPMWLYSFKNWIPSQQVYDRARSAPQAIREGAPSPEVLDAVGVIFSARCWLQQRRTEVSCNQAGPHSGLLINQDDVYAFVERFGEEGIGQLNAARLAISYYRHDALQRQLERGVVVPNTGGLVHWGENGLRCSPSAEFEDSTNKFFALYRAQQQWGLPIDAATERAMRQQIARSVHPSREFIRMLVSPGPISPALEEWANYGVLEKLVPGYGELARKLYAPQHRTASLTRAMRARGRVANLDDLEEATPGRSDELQQYFLDQYLALGASALGAVRLALLTEEIPETLYGPDGEYSDWVQQYVEDELRKIPALSGPTLRTVQFLVEMKREVLRDSEIGGHAEVIDRWIARIDEVDSRDAAHTIRALALFAYSAFDFRRPEGAERDRLTHEQWKNVQNFTENLLHRVLEVSGENFDPIHFDELGQRIGELLPDRLLAGPLVSKAPRVRTTHSEPEPLDPERTHNVIHALVGVVKTDRPRVVVERDNGYFRLALYAWDSPGLFWRVAGALHEAGCSLRATHLYSITDQAEEQESKERFSFMGLDHLRSGLWRFGGALYHMASSIGGTPLDSSPPQSEEEERSEQSSSSPLDRLREEQLIVDVLTFDGPEAEGEGWEDRLTDEVLRRATHPEDELSDNTSEILGQVMDILSPRLTDYGNGKMKFSFHSPEERKGILYAIARILAERTGASIDSIARDGTFDWTIPRKNFYLTTNLAAEDMAVALQPFLGDVSVVLTSDSREGEQIH